MVVTNIHYNALFMLGPKGIVVPFVRAVSAAAAAAAAHTLLATTPTWCNRLNS